MLALLGYIRQVSKINTFQAIINTGAYIQICNYPISVNAQEEFCNLHGCEVPVGCQLPQEWMEIFKLTGDISLNFISQCFVSLSLQGLCILLIEMLRHRLIYSFQRNGSSLWLFPFSFFFRRNDARTF